MTLARPTNPQFYEEICLFDVSIWDGATVVSGLLQKFRFNFQVFKNFTDISSNGVVSDANERKCGTV